MAGSKSHSVPTDTCYNDNRIIQSPYLMLCSTKPWHCLFEAFLKWSNKWYSYFYQMDICKVCASAVLHRPFCVCILFSKFATLLCTHTVHACSFLTKLADSLEHRPLIQINIIFAVLTFSPVQICKFRHHAELPPRSRQIEFSFNLSVFFKFR